MALSSVAVTVETLVAQVVTAPVSVAEAVEAVGVPAADAEVVTPKVVADQAALQYQVRL